MARLHERIAPFSAMTDDLRACTFQNFDTQAAPNAVAAYNAVVRWVTDESPWVYVYGPPGNGKTHLAAAAVIRLAEKGRAVLFLTGPELLAMVRTGFDQGDAEALVRLCQRVEYLAVDDFGAEHATDWALETWFRILNTRYNSRAATLIVSNVAPDAIPEPRLASRFSHQGVCLVAANTGQDYRRRTPSPRKGPTRPCD